MTRTEMSACPDGPGEEAFHRWLRGRQAGLSIREEVITGPGADDLAVLRLAGGNGGRGGLMLLGCDPVLDGVHLEVERDGYAAAGRKAMNRNLSDVAAMGGEAMAALVSLILPRSITPQQAADVYCGAETAGLAVDCPIVGGDTASWEGRLALVVAVMGRSEQPVGRGQVWPGQRIYVTGPLGGSSLGRHLTFEPRLAEARQIVAEAMPTAMLDISDGLGVDLPRLLGERYGARVDAARVPIHDDARRLAKESGRDPLWHALHDGEDYELLFAAEADIGGPWTCIGEVESEPGVRLERNGKIEPLEARGWEHKFG